MTQQIDTERQALPRRGRLRSLTGVICVTLAAGLLLAGSVLGISRAAAVWHEIFETGRPGYLTLRADQVAPHWQDLSPGDRVNWQIEASLDDAISSTLDLELRSDGSLVNTGEMLVSVTACTSDFDTSDVNPRCTGDATTVLAETPLSAVAHADHGEIFSLARLHAGTPRYLLVTLSIPAAADAANMSGSSMRVGVGLHASGDSATVNPDRPPALAATGTDLLILLLLAVGLIGLIAGIMLLRKARART